MSTKFKRTIENFTCENCGKKVTGNGYTNHCPFCLWSKHVDIHPGDRAEVCGGLMQPVKIEIEKKEQILTHQCKKCGAKKRNKTSSEDNLTELLKLSEKTAQNLLLS